MLTRPFEFRGELFLSVAPILFCGFDPEADPLAEVDLWKFTAAELGRDGVIDMGMPKARGEALVRGSAFPGVDVARAACRVRLQVGAVDKTLLVVGDRRWERGAMTEPEPFREIPLSYERAFGGEGYPLNPLGKGFAPVETPAGPVHALPNVEDPRAPVQSIGDRRPPAGFGPLDFSWPQRAAKAGTYDARWLKERFPGLADDVDWGLFNAAPDDQQLDGFFRGDEGFALEGMHPRLPRVEGRLPGLAARAFVTMKRRDGESFEEVATRLDTVWFFPHAERCVLLFRGVVRVAEDDASDVLHLLLATERLGEAMPVDHYRALRDARLDRKKGHLLALRDKDLMPHLRGRSSGVASAEEGSPLATEGLLKANLRRRAEAERQRAMERVAAAGLDPASFAIPPLPPEEPPPDLDELGAIVERAEAQAEEMKRDAEQRKKAAEDSARAACAEHGIDYDKVMGQGRGGPPRFSAEEELAKLRSLAYEARESGTPLPEIEAMAADPAFAARLREGEQRLWESYKRFGHHFPAAAAMDPERAAVARREVERRVAAGEGLARVDLTGADLTGAVLRGVDLRGSLLEGARLAGADLTGAELSDTVLVRADLTDAVLVDAKLTGANLGAATLERTRLDRADLTRATLAKATLRGATLAGATLTKVDLMEATVEATDFSSATASEVIFLRVDLAGASFTGADLRKAIFIELSVAGADFRGATLDEAVFLKVKGDDANFSGARLKSFRVVHESSLAGARFAEAEMEAANLRGTVLARSELGRARLRGADLSECDLRDARAWRCEAVDARFAHADLSGASFVGANLMQSLLRSATVEGADFTGANLFRADLTRVRGKVKSLTDAELTQVCFVPRREA